MQIRIIRFGSRNPIVRAALAVFAVALVLAVVVFGLALLAGLAAVGAAALVARRLLGARRPTPAAPVVRDPALEVFPAERTRVHVELPPRTR